MLFNLQSSAAVIFLCVDDVEEKALAEEQETWIPEWAGSALQSRYCEPLSSPHLGPMLGFSL